MAATVVIRLREDGPLVGQGPLQALPLHADLLAEALELDAVAGDLGALARHEQLGLARRLLHLLVPFLHPGELLVQSLPVPRQLQAEAIQLGLVAARGAEAAML